MFQNAQKLALCDVKKGTPRLSQVLSQLSETIYFSHANVQKVQQCQSQQEANVFAEADLLIRSMKRRSNTEKKLKFSTTFNL